MAGAAKTNLSTNDAVMLVYFLLDLNPNLLLRVDKHQRSVLQLNILLNSLAACKYSLQEPKTTLKFLLVCEWSERLLGIYVILFQLQSQIMYHFGVELG